MTTFTKCNFDSVKVKFFRTIRTYTFLFFKRHSGSHQWCFKVRHDRRVPGGRHHRVYRILLLRAVHLLHVDWGAVLSLWLGMLTVHTRVHTAEAVLTEECVNGLNTCLEGAKGSERRESGMFDSSEDATPPLFL